MWTYRGIGYGARVAAVGAVLLLARPACGEPVMTQFDAGAIFAPWGEAAQPVESAGSTRTTREPHEAGDSEQLTPGATSDDPAARWMGAAIQSGPSEASLLDPDALPAAQGTSDTALRIFSSRIASHAALLDDPGAADGSVKTPPAGDAATSAASTEITAAPLLGSEPAGTRGAPRLVPLSGPVDSSAVVPLPPALFMGALTLMPLFIYSWYRQRYII